MRRIGAAVAAILVAPVAVTTVAGPAAAWTPYAIAFPSCRQSVQVRAVQNAQVQQIVAAPTAPSPSPTPSAAAALDTSGGTVINKTVIGAAAIEQTSHEGTFGAIRGVPGVQDTQSRASSGADSLQIRGIKLNNSANYRMEGALVLNNQVNLPVEDKCKIEALKGAGAVEYGIASPAGIINYVLKRAIDRPVNSVGYVTNSTGQAIASFESGHRFGSTNQFGLDVIGATGQMGSFANGAEGQRYVSAVTGDWKINKRAIFQFDAEQLGINVIEQSSLLLNKPVNGRIALPDPKRVDPSNLLSGSWAYSRGWEQNLAARLGYALSPNTSFIVETGRSEANRPLRDVTQIGQYNVVTGKGTSTVTFVQNQDYINDFYTLQLRTHTEHAWLSNDLTIGLDRNQRNFNNPQNPKITLTQNIYTPTPLPPQYTPTAIRAYQPNYSHDLDPYFSDTVAFGRTRIIGGLRQISYESNDTAADGSTKRTQSSSLAPAAAIIYDLAPNISAYASYVESLEETGQAPASAANAYAVLAPAKASQKEVGIRGTNLGRFTPTLAYFRIQEANATTDPVTNIFALNGTILYEGLESTVQVRASRRLTLDASAIYMRGRQYSDDPTIDGRPPENMPNLNYSLGFAYQLPFAPGWTFTMGRRYTGWRETDPNNYAQLPTYTLLTTGLSYTRLINGHRFDLSLSGSNLLNKRYLSSAISGNLGVGAPQSFSLTSRIDLGQ
ncbi:MAG: TonB-dependent receptor [Candidatus Eremiobacteraeota bacterium]|nr:TonB-dependent receptor [Candidatus Eremiobacteraeota bacterium]